ncbi:hypothetical protein SKAU_G00206680 [Synaphobranchus kaupii]|uniref:MHC class I-like antigen recognition-like domain-containing protein n=1 Tax=Synaphobranchus kaupii TaxID=118154 RepID=A0A9Q1FGJ7_SYNKA|nr:hypothetical protein SKAU_G00206680 [Synaphobranchus kaupii]
MLILVTFSILWTVSFSLPGAKETLIQFRFSGIVGRTETSDTLTIDSVPITWSDRRNNGFLSINTECEAPFRLTLRMIRRSFNHTTANNHTYQRTRECLLEGRRVLQVSDRIQYDGAEYLSLDSAANTWTAAVSQALALKQQWGWDNGRTEKHKIHLEDGCTELIKAFSRDENPAPDTSLGVILIPILVIVVFCQFIFSFFISRHGSNHAGGVLGSIIHYPVTNVAITPSKGDPEKRDSALTPSTDIQTSLLVMPA